MSSQTTQYYPADYESDMIGELVGESFNDIMLNVNPMQRMSISLIWKCGIIYSANLWFCCSCSPFLYIYGPYFIKENSPYRIAEIRIIEYCYGYIPGGYNSLHDNYFILDGSSSGWPVTFYLKKGMTSQQCDKYVNASTLSNALSTYDDFYGNTTHMTMIFKVFVFYIL